MIITALLDTDLYKFTTSYAYTKLFPQAVGMFSFTDRNNEEYSDSFIKQLNEEIDALCSVKLTESELEYMCANCRFLPRVYWEWLSSFKFDRNKIELKLDDEHHLHITVSDYLYKATLYEVPILAIVSELKNKYHGNNYDVKNIEKKLSSKLKISNDNALSFSEFGTRRRFSVDVQDKVISYIKDNAQYCNGTSNCKFAMKYGMKMMGTHPHEWFMFHGAQFGYRHANYMALENWVNVYDGDLGIALSDTYTTDIFLSNISRKQAKLFDGVRCDSGNEFEFIDKLINRYKELGIDSTTKTIVFSNALDFEKALEIQNYCKGKIRCSFGIGTNLTNDTGFKPSNIVMKLTKCKMNPNQEWRDCIKISDDIGKQSGSDEEMKTFMYEYNTHL